MGRRLSVQEVVRQMWNEFLGAGFGPVMQAGHIDHVEVRNRRSVTHLKQLPSVARLSAGIPRSWSSARGSKQHRLRLLSTVDHGSARVRSPERLHMRSPTGIRTVRFIWIARPEHPSGLPQPGLAASPSNPCANTTSSTGHSRTATGATPPNTSPAIGPTPSPRAHKRYPPSTHRTRI